jgi:hypothetical protein
MSIVGRPSGSRSCNDQHGELLSLLVGLGPAAAVKKARSTEVSCTVQKLFALPRHRHDRQQPTPRGAAVSHAIPSRTSANRSWNESCQATPTCRSSCSARRMSRRSSSISIRFRKSLRRNRPGNRAALLVHGPFGPHQPVARGFHLPGREMLDVAAHEGRNEARPEMMHVRIGHDGDPAEILNMP